MPILARGCVHGCAHLVGSFGGRHTVLQSGVYTDGGRETDAVLLWLGNASNSEETSNVADQTNESMLSRQTNIEKPAVNL